MAATIEEALSRAGVDLPVYGQINDPEAEHDRVEVRCDSMEEVIPGNYTMQLNCSVVLMVSATATDSREVLDVCKLVGKVVRDVLMRPWRYVPLADPRSETDAEYEQNPYIVLDLVAEPANVSVTESGYELQADFRAYVQF